MKRFAVIATSTVAVTIVNAAIGAERVYTAANPANPAAVASPRDDWYANVQAKFDKYGNRHADVVFDGDSITNRWETTGRAEWASRFAGRSADFGIEGDRVENVLWRLAKGQVDGVDPKVVVLMIGTNNISKGDRPAQVAEGIKVLVGEYLRRCPRAHLILMATFPRSARPTDAPRKKVEEVNRAIAPLAEGNDRVSFVDLSKRLEQPDGTITPQMMPDFLHPDAAGYRIWADAIQPIVEQHLGGTAAGGR